MKVQQDESYLSTGDLAALNTSFHTGFAPGTHRVPASHVSTGPRSVSRPCNLIQLIIKLLFSVAAYYVIYLAEGKKKELLMLSDLSSQEVISYHIDSNGLSICKWIHIDMILAQVNIRSLILI